MDIDNGYNMAFSHFQVDKIEEKFAPLIELCDQKTMNHWYDFFKWYYCKNVLEGSYGYDPNFDFKISPLMSCAMGCCDVVAEKYTVDHLQYYSCETCDGDGDIDEEECEDCNGTGEDNELLDDACIDTINSIDTSVFLELSKITSELLD
mgnify:CR=1 FL=1